MLNNVDGTGQSKWILAIKNKSKNKKKQIKETAGPTSWISVVQLLTIPWIHQAGSHHLTFVLAVSFTTPPHPIFTQLTPVHPPCQLKYQPFENIYQILLGSLVFLHSFVIIPWRQQLQNWLLTCLSPRQRCQVTGTMSFSSLYLHTSAEFGSQIDGDFTAENTSWGRMGRLN